MVKNAGSKNKRGRLMKNMKSPNSGLIYVRQCIVIYIAIVTVICVYYVLS